MQPQDVLNGLNDMQKTVASYVDGKAVVLAGAGSGKTHTLTRRIAYLLSIGVPPWKITAVSFTKKASLEIKERVLGMMGTEAIDVKMGTFHAMCMRTLLPNQTALYRHGLLNQETMTILSEDDRNTKIQDICLMYGLVTDDEIALCKSFIGDWSTSGLKPLEVKTEPTSEVYLSVYREFVQFKKMFGYADYDDILSLTLDLLKLDDSILDKVSRNVQYFMVDECQDLNDIQFNLLFYLTSHHENYMLIGDDLQSLYRFRGANVQNMIGIKDIEPDIDVLLLERNYRSTQTIVNASNGLIGHNINQLDKTAYSERETGNPIYAYVSPDEVKEADYVVNAIQGFVSQGKYDYSDISVIFRSAWISRQLEMALSSVGIPFAIKNGLSFYERQEIKDIASYLRVIQNPTDDLALKRIINVPKRGIGEGTLDKIQMYAIENDVSLYAALQHLDDIKRITKKVKESVSDFLVTLDELRTYAFDSPSVSIHYLINMVIRKTNYIDMLNPEKIEDETRIENLAELAKIGLMFDSEWEAKVQMGEDDEDHNRENALNRFIAGTALFDVDGVDDDEDVEDNKVTLTTIHSAKGLEWPLVFIIGLEEGVFPSSRAVTIEDLEEERRAMYVAMTRAKDFLFLSYNQQRYFYNATPSEQKPSRFLSEIPKQYLNIIGWTKEQVEA